MRTDDLLGVLAELDGVHDGVEAVDELAHALQSAELARLAGADPALVAAALLHDVGRAPSVAAATDGLEHDVAGAVWLEDRLGRPGHRTAWLVGAHVAAKVYLVASDPGYRAGLSDESVRSLAGQQGSIDGDVLSHPWWPDALRLRRWDDLAKDPDARPPVATEVVALLAPLFEG